MVFCPSSHSPVPLQPNHSWVSFFEGQRRFNWRRERAAVMPGCGMEGGSQLLSGKRFWPEMEN
jgi:hypothetical protein